KKLLELSAKAIPVDEIFGLKNVFSAIPQIIGAAYNTFYEKELKKGAIKLIKLLRDYEEFKKEIGGMFFFNIDEPRVKIEDPSFIFISSAFLPKVETLPSDEVWGWAEDEAMPVVFNYEGLNGREAIRVSGHEHYDIRSVKRGKDGRILEERFIEVKTKIKKSLSVSLKEEEFRAAREIGDNYWLYLVYGVKTEEPVILCIRNPLKRLSFRKKIAVEKREEYYFSVGGDTR
ncbi:MAG: DUF3883 domain-containing protein, partial [Candidatus Baldrarchaeia archaeon]